MLGVAESCDAAVLAGALAAPRLSLLSGTPGRWRLLVLGGASSWRSPGARRSTPTWATSGRCRSASPGSAWRCRRWSSTTSARAALLLSEPNSPDVLDSPFYALAPPWAHIPLIILATVATVIASQSIISGAYSMTQQAISLGFLPRMRVVHTEGREIGQIYVPFVNWALAIGTLTAVIGLRSSDALAGAFGIAVSLLMVITTLLATFVALHWKHNPFVVFMVNGSLLVLDLLFFASTSTKLFDGGWFPLFIAFVISFLMLTWRKGEEVMDTVRVRFASGPRISSNACAAIPRCACPERRSFLGAWPRACRSLCRTMSIAIMSSTNGCCWSRPT